MQFRRDQKVVNTDALAHSKPTFNMHVWNHLADGEAQRMETEYMKGYRLATGHRATTHHNKHITNLQILARANRPSMETIMRVHRLRYLSRLLNYGPTIPLRLIDANARAKNSWAQDFDSVFEWMS